jgi:hypothetical protein
MVPSSSWLLSLNSHAIPAVQFGASKAAVGGVFAELTVTVFVIELSAPASSVTVSLTLYSCTAVKVVDGFAPVAVSPFPNSQLRLTMVPSSSRLSSSNWQATSTVQLGAMKAAVGGVLGAEPTVTLFVTELSAPRSSVTVSFTLYSLAVGKVVDGFAPVPVCPFPKSQARLAMAPSSSLLLSLNSHAVPAVQLGASKAAVGGVLAKLTVTVFVIELSAPPSSVTVSLTL